MGAAGRAGRREYDAQRLGRPIVTTDSVGEEGPGYEEGTSRGERALRPNPDGPLRGVSELDLYVARPPRAARMLLAGLSFLLVVAGALGFWLRVDTFVRSSGIVRPEREAVAVSAPVRGRVTEMNVRSGGVVRQGNVLVRLAAEEIEARLSGVRRRLSESRRKLRGFRWILSRLKDPADTLDLERAPEALPEPARSSVMELVDAVKLARVRLGEARREASRKSQLAERRFIAQVEAEQAKVALRRARLELRHVKSRTRRDLADRLAESEAEIVQLENERDRLRRQREQRVIRAPVDGTVANLAIRRPDQLVVPEQPILRILPEDVSSIVETEISPRDRGRVHVGQRVELQFPAYRHGGWGTAKGRVESIAPDATFGETGLPEGYRTVVSFDRASVEDDLPEGRKIEPGMMARLYIQTEEVRVLELVLRSASSSG